MEPFYTKSGKEVSSLSEMADALQTMSDEDFNHHVTPQRNDIAIWVEDVHHDETLAKTLSQTQDKETMIKILSELDSATFPHTEEYNPATAAGKDDANLHETYNKPEEWQAAKEAAHPDEEVHNPATGSLQQIANEYNQDKPQDELQNPNNQSVEQNMPTEEPEVPIDDELQNSNQKTSQEVEQTTQVTSTEPVEPKIATHDLNPSEHSKKDKLIYGLAGFIIGIIVGYGITFLLGW